MRLALVTAFALLPTAAFAQSASSNSLLAMATAPTPNATSDAPKPVAPATTVEAIAASGIARANTGHLHDVIATSVNMNLREMEGPQVGARTFTFGSDESEVVSEPKLVHVVNRTLRKEDAIPGKADVTVSMRVSTEGVPSDLHVVQSAGSAIDKDTLAAVSQYRFKPGTLNRLPAESSVTVRIQLEK